MVVPCSPLHCSVNSYNFIRCPCDQVLSQYKIWALITTCKLAYAWNTILNIPDIGIQTILQSQSSRCLQATNYYGHTIRGMYGEIGIPTAQFGSQAYALECPRNAGTRPSSPLCIQRSGMFSCWFASTGSSSPSLNRQGKNGILFHWCGSLFRRRKDGPFVFKHCWDVLRKEPKWNSYLKSLA